ncbi:nicotinate-nucleotide--dimethylbenzimidazole phosphoribosyltransferase [Streptomyces sp. t39]|uniref:nicotinate-nucleotide--dimethylbenzimidazole phosphoribosyltransferase n=2 Tax=Streptomyces sp. t39 TaxID=1828156 RepID=UPI003966DF84
MSRLNLDDFSDLIERPDSGVRRDAEERRERLVVPAGALGRLDELAEWLAAAQAAVPVRAVDRPRVVLFAGDHGVAELGVSGRAAGTAHELVRAVLDGGRPVSVLARRSGVPVRIVDAGLDCDPELLPEDVTRHRVRRGSGRIDIEDALTVEEAEQAVRLGMAIADEEADSGTDVVVLGDLSVGGTTAAATLIAALCGTDACPCWPAGRVSRCGSSTPVWTAIRNCFPRTSPATGCGAAAGASTSRTRSPSRRPSRRCASAWRSPTRRPTRAPTWSCSATSASAGRPPPPR